MPVVSRVVSCLVNMERNCDCRISGWRAGNHLPGSQEAEQIREAMAIREGPGYYGPAIECEATAEWVAGAASMRSE